MLQQPSNAPAKEHFELLKEEWTQAVDKLTATLDGAADAGKLVRALESQMTEDHQDIKKQRRPTQCRRSPARRREHGEEGAQSTHGRQTRS